MNTPDETRDAVEPVSDECPVCTAYGEHVCPRSIAKPTPEDECNGVAGEQEVFECFECGMTIVNSVCPYCERERRRANLPKSEPSPVVAAMLEKVREMRDGYGQNSKLRFAADDILTALEAIAPADVPATVDAPPTGQHKPDCAWELATCEYKDTHYYCPHPEHACTCVNAVDSTLRAAGIDPDSLLPDFAEHLRVAIPKAEGESRANLETALSYIEKQLKARVASAPPTETVAVGDDDNAMAKYLLTVVEEGERLRKLSNRELVIECLQISETDCPVVEEMMNRLYPEWSHAPDAVFKKEGK